MYVSFHHAYKTTWGATEFDIAAELVASDGTVLGTTPSGGPPRFLVADFLKAAGVQSLDQEATVGGNKTRYNRLCVTALWSRRADISSCCCHTAPLSRATVSLASTLALSSNTPMSTAPSLTTRCACKSSPSIGNSSRLGSSGTEMRGFAHLGAVVPHSENGWAQIIRPPQYIEYPNKVSEGLRCLDGRCAVTRLVPLLPYLVADADIGSSRRKVHV